MIENPRNRNDKHRSPCQIESMTPPKHLSEKIVEIARRLHLRNCLAAADGNISVRMSDDEIWMTPTGVAKAFMKASEMACINLKNEIRSGRPSGERLMHLEIYRQCPKAKAIVHAHPPTAIAWTLARPDLKELPFDSLPEVVLATGRVPIADYARPGTSQMGDNLKSFLPAHRAILLARHGAVAWGEDLEEAWRGIERIEHAALILLAAEQLGGARPVPKEEMDRLTEMRKAMGETLL